jgi:NTE family protein
MAWQEPRDEVALCLSGGGYRAMLFHLGTLWRLNELGYLADLGCVCSVSGGSITAAVLGLHWDELEFRRRANGRVAVNFDQHLVDPIRALAGRTIDRKALAFGLVPGLTVGNRLAAAYRKHLFGEATLQDLPDERHGPEFVIKATNLQSGVLWRFSRAQAADYRVGRIRWPQVPLADAVAASSAFPPFLGPMRLRFSEDDYAPRRRGEDLHEPPFTTRPTLVDGGVYDNLGQEVAWRSCKTVLISDGGGFAKADGGGLGPFPWRWRDWGSQTLRVLKTVDNQVRNLRKRRAIAGFNAPPGSVESRHGAYWGIRSDIRRYQLPSSLPVSPQVVEELAAVRTRLRRLDSATQERLVNWGYAICDTAMRRWVDPALPAPPRLPYPDSPLDA